MSRLRFALLGTAVVLVAAGAGVVLWKRTHPDPLDEARKRAMALKTTYTIDFPGITLRSDDKCKLVYRAQTLQCDTWSVHWTLEAEANTDPIPLIVHGMTKDEMGYRMGLVEIAGFNGAIDTHMGTMRPITMVAFTGWRDDPTRGRWKLTLTTDGWGGGADERDGAAVLLTLALAPRGLLDKIPTPQDYDYLARVLEGFDQLGGADREAWMSGAYTLGSQPSEMVTDFVRARSPSGSEEIGKRIDEHGRDVVGFDNAVSLVIALQQLEPALAHTRAVALAADLRGAWSFTSADAAKWVDLELRFGTFRTQTQKDAPAFGEVVRYLGALDSAIVQRNPRHSLELLRRNATDPSATALLARWLDPAHVTADADFAALAQFVAQGWERDPTLRNHIVKSLANRSPAGEWEAPDKTKVPLRVCDWYARIISRDGLPFDASASSAERDRQIVEIRKFAATFLN